MRLTKKFLKFSAKNLNPLGKSILKHKRILATTFMATSLTTAGVKFFMKHNTFNELFFTKAEASDQLQTIDIGSSDDFVDGKMNEIQVGDDKDKDIILVTRIGGKLYACGAKCSHFGAPLSKGMLFEDRVYCPFHLASFSVVTGYPDNGPMYNGIPTYKIWEENGKVFVEAPKKVTEIRAPVPMVTRDPSNNERYVIVGGGVAAGSAAETLRQAGFTGEILMLTNEEALPYDRTLLTKGDGPLLKMPVDKLYYRSQDFLNKIGVTVKTGTTVVDVNPKKKNVVTDEGKKISYDKLLVATGASAKVPPIQGVNLSNVFTIRDFADVQKLRENFNEVKNVVVVGAGFIGVEAAAAIKTALKDNGNVTIVSQGQEAYSHSLGNQVGRAMRLWTEEHGVKYHFGSGIKKIVGDGTGKATQVVLENGQTLDADLVVMGTGVRPNTWFLKNKIALDRDGGINADVFMRSTTDKDIFAAGDVVSFPYYYTAERVRVEHLSEAIGTGAYAAMNMVGKMVPYSGVPFFWTRAFNKSLAYVGHTSSYDNVVIDGSPEKFNFAAYYVKQNRIVAAAGMFRGADLIMLNQAMRLNIVATTDMLNGTKLDLEKLRGLINERKPQCACSRAKDLE